jgi:NADPH:quinone reductase-like Zn-dependent oxidoreductase
VPHRPSSSLRTQDDRGLVVLKDLIEAGKVTPVIDRIYPLSEAPQAIAYVGEGQARGKVAITP